MIDLRDKEPLRGMGEVLRLSWPASLSMLNSTLMRFVDGWMVSFVGAIPFTSQFVAGLASFVPESFATGMLTVVNTYVSQNLGAKRFDRCGQYAWAGLLMALGFCLLIAPLIFFARPIFLLLRQDPDLLPSETMYFQFMVGAVFLTLTARPLEQFFYGIHRPKVVMTASIVANVHNIVWDYILIFGKLGFPAMGLRGAAVATLLSWALYLGILFIVFTSPRIDRQFSTVRPKGVRLSQCLDLVRIGWPAGLEFFNDVLPWLVMVSVLVGRFGANHETASSAAMRWMPLSFMPAVGIGVATTAIVGKYIGEGRPDLARRRAHAGLALATAYMGACGLVFLLLRYPMIRMFVNTPPGVPPEQAAKTMEEVIRIGGWVMICAAVFQLGDAIGIVYMGALRGAGDTFRPMLMTISLSWGVMVGGGWLMTEALPQLASVGPWIAGTLYVILLGLVMARRFEGGAWRKIDLLHRGGLPAAPLAPPGAVAPPGSEKSDSSH